MKEKGFSSLPCSRKSMDLLTIDSWKEVKINNKMLHFICVS